MAQHKQTAEDIRRNIINNLSWRAATRDDRQVAQAIHQGEEMEAIYGLNEVGLLDEFWHFLELVGILALMVAIPAPTVERVIIPIVQMVSLYLLKVLFGIVTMNALPSLLFSNGFNAHQVRHGFTKRGDHARKQKPKQGPLSPQCLAQNISRLSIEGVMAFFNSCIRCLAAFGFFAAEVTAVVDGSRIETTDKYEGPDRTAAQASERGWLGHRY